MDPTGSVLARPAQLDKKSLAFQVNQSLSKFHSIFTRLREYFIPDYTVVDIWDKSDDAEAFMFAHCRQHQELPVSHDTLALQCMSAC